MILTQVPTVNAISHRLSNQLEILFDSSTVAHQWTPCHAVWQEGALARQGWLALRRREPASSLIRTTSSDNINFEKSTWQRGQNIRHHGIPTLSDTLECTDEILNQRLMTNSTICWRVESLYMAAWKQLSNPNRWSIQSQPHCKCVQKCCQGVASILLSHRDALRDIRYHLNYIATTTLGKSSNPKTVSPKRQSKFHKFPANCIDTRRFPWNHVPSWSMK